MPVSRRDVAAWSFNLHHRPLAERLKKCIEDGKAFKGFTVEKDVNGNLYASVEQAGFFHGRHMNAELEKLGY
jgi:hypothetical protein